MQEFTIKALPDKQFRVAKISPIELLAITAQIDFDKFTQTTELFKFALEHTEVKEGEKWSPVKYANREVYSPLGIDTNLVALNEIITYFLNEVIAKTFTQSSE